MYVDDNTTNVEREDERKKNLGRVRHKKLSSKKEMKETAIEKMFK